MEDLELLKTGDPILREHGFCVMHFPEYQHEVSEPHALDVVLFSWFASGSGHHTIAENTFSVSPGSMGITPAGISHDIVTAGTMDVYNLCIDTQVFAIPDLPSPFMPYLPILLPLHSQQLAGAGHMIQIESKRKEIITRMFEELMHEQGQVLHGKFEMCRVLISVILMYLVRDVLDHGYEIIGRVRLRQSDALVRVISHVDATCTQRHTLGDLAVRFGFSKASLCLNFRKATGFPVFDYIHRRRIDRARMLLRTTTMRIIEVAAECGYDDVSFFNRKFKQVCGCTPRNFRTNFCG